MSRRLGMMLAAGGVLATFGCGSDGDPEPTPASATSTPAPTATPEPPAALGEVTWTTSLLDTGEPAAAITTFWREETVIHAVVEVTNLDEGEQLTAAWTMNGMAIEGTDSTVEIEEDTARGWVAFTLTWDGAGLWPVGTLGITITARSGATSSGTISIVSTQ